MSTSALQDAIEKAGNQERLAELLTRAAKDLPKGNPSRRRRFSQQNISYWLSQADGLVPIEVAPLFEPAVGITAQIMRPDFFGLAAA